MTCVEEDKQRIPQSVFHMDCSFTIHLPPGHFKLLVLLSLFTHLCYNSYKGVIVMDCDPRINDLIKQLSHQQEYTLQQVGLYELKRLADRDPAKYGKLYQEESQKPFIPSDID